MASRTVSAGGDCPGDCLFRNQTKRMQGGAVASEFFEEALDLASGPNRGNKLVAIRL